jgi:hypothetical protein
MVLHRGQVAGVAPRRVGSEADHQLRAVAVDRLGAEKAERMRRADRVLVQRLPARADEDLDPARGLAERDRRQFVVRERRRELDRAERIQRDRGDRRARAAKPDPSRVSTSTRPVR